MSKKTTEQFIKEAIKIHGNKYDYSKTVYKGATQKVTITCPIHGDFEQLPSNHLRGSGCRECSVENAKNSTEEFIKKAKEIHGDKYDYSKTKYVNGHTKVEIICPVHGSFWQIPNDHLYGHGCRLCSNTANGNVRNKGREDFIERARAVHGDKYDYSKVEYVNSNTKVCIICPEHGEFWQTPSSHLKGKGCKRCVHPNADITNDEFISKAKAVHGNKYDYSKVEYKGMNKKVCIICPVHGEFWQTPKEHLKGHGCVHCKGNDTYSFIEKAKAVHGDRYDYSDVKYYNNSTKVSIICPKHGVFEQRPSTHLEGKGCPKCGGTLSRGEEELYEYYINALGENAVERKNRKILNGKEIDLYFPEYRLGIEFNGIKWHSEEYRVGKNYHLDKTLECEKKGIRLIHIFEDEWNDKKEIVIDKINNFLNLNKDKPKIRASKCSIVVGNYKTSEKILNDNHIQGAVRATVYLNAYYNGEIIGAMLFTKRGDRKWELVRWVGDNRYILEGLASKTFSFFLKEYEPEEVKSFLDRRYCFSDHNLYEKLGFTLDSYVKPDYKYTKNGCSRQHKFNFRKKILAQKYGLDENLTETEMVKEIGFYRIWDCGLVKYIWKSK